MYSSHKLPCTDHCLHRFQVASAPMGSSHVLARLRTLIQILSKMEQASELDSQMANAHLINMILHKKVVSARTPRQHGPSDSQATMDRKQGATGTVLHTYHA